MQNTAGYHFKTNVKDFLFIFYSALSANFTTTVDSSNGASIIPAEIK
jgi:hypothetical protein